MKVRNLARFAKEKADAFAIKGRIRVDSTAAILADSRGESNLTSSVIGIIISVVIGLLLLNQFTGLFSNTVFPTVKSKIEGMFGS